MSIMRPIRRLAAAVLAASCAVAAPAPAATITETCFTQRFEMSVDTRQRSAGSFWVLSDTRYRLRGGSRRMHDGRKYGYSNFNMEIISDGETVFSSYSPDTRIADGRRYRIRHTTRVRKDATTYVSYQAIFDVPWVYDPRCSVDSAELEIVLAPEPEVVPPAPMPAPAPPAQAPPAPSLLDRLLPPH